MSIPDSVTEIGDYAFLGCEGLTSLTIGHGVTTIGDEAFSQCRWLTSVTIPGSVTTIGEWAFSSCVRLASVEIPDGVTSIADYAFMACDNLTRVVLGKSVTSIGFSAFRYCDSLTDISIPDSVTSIGVLAFNECDDLRRVMIPHGVTIIGEYAFFDCTSLTGVYFAGHAPIPGASLFLESENVTVYYLPNATGWGDTFAERPAVLWNPVISEPSFDVGGTGFSFQVTGTENIPIAVEATDDLLTGAWMLLGTDTLAGGVREVRDEDAASGLLDHQRIHRHGAGAAVHDVDGMVAGCQAGDLAHHLLGLASALDGQVRHGASHPVDLNLHHPGAHFFWSDDPDTASVEWGTPDIAWRLTDGEVIVELAGAQVASANPPGIPRARVIVIEPALVMRDAQDAAGGRQ